MSLYVYGTLESGSRARRNRITGAIQILLWKSGEQGHKVDYWHQAGAGHRFIAEKPKEGGE